MNTLIVATDFSAAAVNAAHYAIHLAKAATAQVHLLHVIDTSRIVTEVPLADGLFPRLEKEAKIQLESLKNELTAFCNGQVTLAVQCVVGTLLPVLRNVCKRTSPRAVVMGAQGRSAFSRILLGSTTQQAIQYLRVPVLVIPPTARFKKIYHLGLACDMHKSADSLPLSLIDWLISSFPAKLYVVHVTSAGRQMRWQAVTDRIEVQHQLAKYQPVFSYIDSTDTETGIYTFIKMNRIEVLLVVPKTRKLFNRFFHQSVSKKLVWHPVIPVMTVHEAG